jgi:hypothetical protein
MTKIVTLGGTLEHAVELSPSQGADAELINVFQEYWDATSRPEAGPTRWSSTVSRVAAGAWGSDTAAAAGAGGVATVRDRICVQCQGPLTLTSRAAFDRAQEGQPVKCRNCTAQYNDRVNRILSPETQLRKEARAIEEQEREAAQDEHQRVGIMRKAAIHAKYSASRGDDSPSTYDADTQTRLVTLAIIRRHMAGGVSIALDDVGEVFAPESMAGLFYETVGQLLVIHPSTPPNAFTWMSEIGPDADTFGGRLYPSRLHLYADGDESAIETAQALEEDLEGCLENEMLTSREQEELLLLARDLVAGEGIRYLEYQLSRYNLPAVPERHRVRLTAVFRRAADNYPLDVIYFWAWGAASAATNYFQAYRTSRDNAATHALNRMEKRIADAIEDPAVHVESYGLIPDLPLTSLTQTLFYDVLGRTTTGASITNLRSTMAQAVDVRLRSLCLVELPEPRTTSMAQERLIDITKDRGGRALVVALQKMLEHPLTICARSCSHDQANALLSRVTEKWSDLDELIGADRASIALIATLPWLDYRDAETKRESPGTIIVEQLLMHMTADNEPPIQARPL